MPAYLGGKAALDKDIKAAFHVPPEVYDEGISGRVVISFMVATDGSIGQVVVARSLHPLVDRAAVNAVLALKPFAPGRCAGQPVEVKYALPFSVAAQ